jgi:hypothetical protein
MSAGPWPAWTACWLPSRGSRFRAEFAAALTLEAIVNVDDDASFIAKLPRPRAVVSFRFNPGPERVGDSLIGSLEPLQASPVIVESDAFIGSRCMLIEGARVGRGAVVGAGIILSPTIHMA